MKRKIDNSIFCICFIRELRDTCHAWQRKCLVKRVAKEGAGRGRMVFKEDLEEADGGEEEDNPSIGEWRPPTDNVTALERQARK